MQKLNLTVLLIRLKIKVISEYKDNYESAVNRYECQSCAAPRHEPQPLSLEKYSTLQAAEGPRDRNDKSKPNINQVIFNDKFALLNPTTHSDYATNYNKPEKSDYRKKRTQLLYPTHNEPSIARETISEYNTRYSGN
jgi:hypothetical protein